MKKAILFLLAAIPCLHAQDVIRQVFQLQYAEPGRVRVMLLGANRLEFDNQMKTIAVETTKERMAEFEQIIKRLDVPPPPVQNVEVTIYLMSALGQPSAAAVPAELEGVVKQLKGMFSYKAYQLIDAQVIRVRAGQGGNALGVVNSGSASEPKTISQISFKNTSVSNDEKGRAIRIDGLRVGLRIPVPSTYHPGVVGPGSPPSNVQYLDTGINTDVDVHEGQKVVVGKANMDGSDRASIVVLTAKVVD